jgi:3-oxoacyl-[acyl-carrier protein] reductase
MSNRVALVTGASRGIGKVTSELLSEAGYDVAIASPEHDLLVELAAAIQAAGRKALVVDLDITSAESVRAGVEKTMQEFGRIDVLVNNAGITRDALAMRMKESDWRAVLDVNLTGAFRMTQQVLPVMMKARFGRIINMASVVGLAGNPGQANYVASKAGLIGLTKCLAQELASRNITVNAVAPGFIETDMTAKLPQEVKDRMMASIPLKRFGQPRDIALAVKFLASDDAAYITGHVLNVNGGMYM